MVDYLRKSLDLVVLKFKHHLKFLIMDIFIIIDFNHKLPWAIYVIIAMVLPLVWTRDYVVIVANSFALIHLAITSTADRIKKGVATLSPIQLNIVFITFQIKTVSRLHLYTLS